MSGNPVNTVPSNNTTFLTDLQAFLRNEDADRFAEQGFQGFVVSGGLNGTGAGLTKTPTSLVAYAGGYRITESGSITYPASETIYVAANKDTTGNSGTYTRVTGTHYLTDSASGSEPTLPAGAVRLMTVTTDGSGVTAVVDRRNFNPIAFTPTNAVRVSAQFDKANSTLANITDLSVALLANRTYSFRVVLFVTADGTSGHKYAMAYSSTVGAVRYDIKAVSIVTVPVFVLGGRQTSSGGASGENATGATAIQCVIEGTITTTGAGNLTAQFACNTGTNTSSVLVGSSMNVWNPD